MDGPFDELCSQCVQSSVRHHEKKSNRTIVPVVGAAIHIFSRLKNNATGTIKELSRFFRMTPGIVYASQPCYDINKVPEQYKTSTYGRELVYWKMLPRLESFNISYIDFYQPTHTCWMDNCTTDGGHRNRFVNRWKAQLLLNKLCDFSSVSS